MKPQLHQKATFYPHSFAKDNAAVEAVVTRICSDSCVNLSLLDAQGQVAGGPTSVLVYDAASTALEKPAGYYCVLQPIDSPAAEPAPAPAAITGYRQLSADEVALINEIKAQGVALSGLLEKVTQHLDKQGHAGDVDVNNRQLRTQPYRWAAMARTDMQLGLMQLVRAVAQPEGM